jgi:hypothetical protein
MAGASPTQLRLTYEPQPLRLIASAAAAALVASARDPREHAPALASLSEEDLALVLAAILARNALTPRIVAVFLKIASDLDHAPLLSLLRKLDIAAGIIVTGNKPCSAKL